MVYKTRNPKSVLFGKLISAVTIDNNLSERCIKTIVIAPMNWLFAGSHEGVKRSAIIYTLAESCKLPKPIHGNILTIFYQDLVTSPWTLILSLPLFGKKQDSLN